MNSEKAEIKVHNIQDKDKKNYLGSIQFDLQRIYNENKDHSLHGQWIGLFNYENEENTGVNGFLRLSMSIQHENDKKVILNLSKDGDSKGNVFLPPQLKQNMSFNQLALYFYEANNIPNMDESIMSFKNDVERMFKDRKKECQGFIKVEYGGIILQTKVSEMMNDRIIWDQVIKIPIPHPRVSDKLFIKLYDHDTYSKEDLIGTYELNLEEIIPAFADIKKPHVNKFKEPKKIHFYGSVPSESGESGISDIMNDNSETGMLYKGSITMKVLKLEARDKPIKEVEDFKREVGEVNDKSHESWNIKLRLYNYYAFNDKSIKDGLRAKFYVSIGEKFQAFEDVRKFFFLFLKFYKQFTFKN